MNRMRVVAGICLTSLLLLTGCGDPPEESDSPAPPVMNAAGSSTYRKTPSELRRELGANEMAKFEMSGNDIVGAKLFRSGVKTLEPLKDLPLISIDLGMTSVSDLTPLQGMPLEEVVLENTNVADLTPLEGMSLRVLKLQNTKVKDLSPIKGMPLEQLNLMGVPISDLSVVEGMPLEILWIPGTDVTDLTPLADSNLVSLDIQGTEVSDLTPLASLPRLQRLNIADTPVSDITVLKDLKLTRITLTPSTIKSGMEDLRSMTTLAEIQTSMESPMSAADFWKRYDLDLYSDPAATESNGSEETGTVPEEDPEGTSEEGGSPEPGGDSKPGGDSEPDGAREADDSDE